MQGTSWASSMHEFLNFCQNFFVATTADVHGRIEAYRARLIPAEPLSRSKHKNVMKKETRSRDTPNKFAISAVCLQELPLGSCGSFMNVARELA
jgi:hypothetical protein